MSTTVPTPAPEPDDISRGLAELELYVAAHAPTLPAPAPVAQLVEDDDDVEDEPQDDPAPLVDITEGETKRVRQLRAEVAEARLLGQLQDDPAPLLIDTLKVRKRRKQAGEAARLHQLAQDPTMRAWQAARMRRLIVTGGMVSLTLALAWSTAGVHGFAADGAPAWSPSWVFAWFVEPFMSIALLVVVGARAYMGTRGQPIKSRTLVWVEAVFLGLTFGMNAFPYLPGVAADFSFPRLVLHILGPIVAVAIVTALPVILAAFAGLDHGVTSGATGRGATSRSYRGNVVFEPGVESGSSRADIAGKVGHIRALIAAGQLPPHPSATAIRKALGCGTDTASKLRDELRGGA